MAGSPLFLIVSVDTEEDDWYPTRHQVTVDNIRELPRFQALVRRLGLRATYFVDYPVATTRWAADVLRDFHEEGDVEIGAHLHPWNTPPLQEALVPRNSMLKNLALPLQLAKVERLRDAIAAGIGVNPVSFRAGRMGLGSETVEALIRAGFLVDSSVTPFVSWEGYDEGPNFIGAPVRCYRVAPHSDVRVPVPDGPLCEVPISCGFTGRPFAWRSRALAFLSRPSLRSLRLAGIASQMNVVRQVIGSPETSTVADLLRLTRCLIDEGTGFVHLFVHSSSLVPGRTPFVSTAADRNRLYRMLERYVEELARMAPIRPATVAEAAEALVPTLEVSRP